MDSRHYNLKDFIIFAVIVGVIIHGYCFTNMNFTHDSMLAGEKTKGNFILFMLSIGRFLFFTYYWLFNIYTTPFFCGLMSLIFLGIGNFYLSVLFKLNRVQSILCSLLVMLSVPFICFSATYILSAPIFALSYALTCIALYFSTFQKKKFFILGIIFQAVALGGEDQSIIQFGCIISLIYIMINLVESNSHVILLNLIARYTVFFVLSGLTYLIIYKATLYIGNIEPATSYNSLSHIDISKIVSNAMNKQFFSNMYTMPINFFKFYKRGNDFPFGVLLANSTYIIYALIVLFPIIQIIRKKITIFTASLFYILVMLSPLIMNSVYLISNGLTHDLMILSFYFPFYFSIVTYGDYINFSSLKTGIVKKNYFNCFRSLIIIIPFFILFLSSYIFTTNVYSVKEHQFNYIKLSTNRILAKLESMSSYRPNISKVIFIGNLDNNNIINGTTRKLPNFSGLNSAESYPGVINSYINGLLGYKLKVVKHFSNIEELLRDQMFIDKHKLTVAELRLLYDSPQFPSHGYIVEIKDIFYIFLSK